MTFHPHYLRPLFIEKEVKLKPRVFVIIILSCANKLSFKKVEYFIENPNRVSDWEPHFAKLESCLADYDICSEPVTNNDTFSPIVKNKILGNWQCI